MIAKNILEVKNLFVKFGDEIVIKDLSFEVKRGSFLTVIGPNGSGKTVLIKSLLKFFPTRGEIVWDKNAKVGYLPQGLTHLKVKGIPLTVEEFLMLKRIKKQKILELSTLVGIKDKKFLKKPIGNLSGGQFQRMLIIWALATDPNVLLFDEPMTGIDVSGEKTIYDLLYKLWKEKELTIILATHDLNIVYKYSTDVLCISKDNICHSTPQEVLLPEILEDIYGMPIKFYKHNH
jgi:zinc transport system ATP-binding protein